MCTSNKLLNCYPINSTDIPQASSYHCSKAVAVVNNSSPPQSKSGLLLTRKSVTKRPSKLAKQATANFQPKNETSNYLYFRTADCSFSTLKNAAFGTWSITDLLFCPWKSTPVAQIFLKGGATLRKHLRLYCILPIPQIGR